MDDSVRAASARSSLTSGRRLVRNVIWNGLGEVGPLIAALIAVPILLHSVGTERFGVIALAWTVFAYFSLFDAGLGPALTKLIADCLAMHRDAEIPSLVWTCVVLMAALGAIGSLSFLAFCPPLVHTLLRVPPGLQTETLHAFYVLGFGLPVGMMVTVLTGTLAAYQRFDLVNAVRGPNTMWSSLGPLLVLPFSHSIVPIVSVLMLGHAITCVIYSRFCLRVVIGLNHDIRVRHELIPKLLGFGGWVSVSNVATLVMHTSDRFVLAAMTSMSAVAFYMVPYRVLQRLRGVHGWVRGVLYPALAFTIAERSERTAVLFDRGAKALLMIMFPVALVTVAMGGDLLALWIGVDFARHSEMVLKILAVGALLDSVGLFAETLIAAAHRPDLSAKIHAVELPFYLGFLTLMIRFYGAEGAAVAWTTFAGIHAFALLVTARIIVPSVAPATTRVAKLLASAVVFLAIAALPSGFGERLATVAIMLTILVPVAWAVLMTNEDRVMVRSYLRAPHLIGRAATTMAD